MRPHGHVRNGPPQPAVVDRIANGPDHVGMHVGFDHVVVRPGSHRRNHLRDAPVGRHHDHGQVAIQLLDLPEHFNAVQAWHPNVQQDHVEQLALDECQRLVAVCRRHGVVALSTKEARQELSNGRLIVYDQDPTDSGVHLVPLRG